MFLPNQACLVVGVEAVLVGLVASSGVVIQSHIASTHA